MTDEQYQAKSYCEQYRGNNIKQEMLNGLIEQRRDKINSIVKPLKQDIIHSSGGNSTEDSLVICIDMISDICEKCNELQLANLQIKNKILKLSNYTPRMILYRRYCESMTFTQIEAVCGLSRQTIWREHQKALTELYGMIESEGKV